MKTSLGWFLVAMALLPCQVQGKCAILNQQELLVEVSRCNSVRYTGDTLHLSRRGALLQVRVLSAREVAVPHGLAAPVSASWQPGAVAQVFVAVSAGKVCSLTLGRAAPLLVRLPQLCCDTGDCERGRIATHTEVVPVHRAMFVGTPDDEEVRERAAVAQALKERARHKRVHRAFREGVSAQPLVP